MPLKEVFFATWNLYALGGPGGKLATFFVRPLVRVNVEKAGDTFPCRFSGASMDGRC